MAWAGGRRALVCLRCVACGRGGRCAHAGVGVFD